MSQDLDSVERAVLQILEPGALGWHEIAVRLGTLDVPRGHDLMAVLKGLRTRGFVINVRTEGGSDRWQLTDPGRALLAPAAPQDGLIAALRGGPSEVISRYKALLSDDAAYEAELRRLLRERPDAIDAVAQGLQLLPEELRARFARELWTSPAANVRRALYRVLEPLRLEVQGTGWKALPDGEWDAFVGAGLDDSDAEVRRIAAALVFSTAAGSCFVEDLLLLVSRGELETPATRETVLLALGSAHDRDSLAALRAAAAGQDLQLAGAAVRALAARPDGKAEALKALEDPSEAVRAAAEFALAKVMTGLEPAELAALDACARTSPSLKEALARYRQR
jgi:hypothetical protein